MEEGGRGARGGATWNTKWPEPPLTPSKNPLYRVRCDTLQRGEKDISVRTSRVDHVSVYRAPTIALTLGGHELGLSLSFFNPNFLSPSPTWSWTLVLDAAPPYCKKFPSRERGIGARCFTGS